MPLSTTATRTPLPVLPPQAHSGVIFAKRALGNQVLDGLRREALRPGRSKLLFGHRCPNLRVLERR